MRIVIETSDAGVTSLEVDGEIHEFHHADAGLGRVQAFHAAAAALAEEDADAEAESAAAAA